MAVRSSAEAKDKLRVWFFLPEFFQVDSFVALDCDQIIISFFIIPHKQVFGLRLRIRKRNGGSFCHVSFVLRHLIPGVSVVSVSVNLTFVHAVSSLSF